MSYNLKNNILCLIVLLVSTALPAQQRKIVPVDTSQPPVYAKEMEREATEGNEPEKQVEETPADSTVKKSRFGAKPIAPLWNGLMVTVNIFDPIAQLFGQRYGNYEIGVELDLQNRFFPTWEIGIGYADNTPEGNNFNYYNPAAVYNRIGLNYNFIYNKPTESFVYGGFRYGVSAFRYDIRDVTVDSPYWGTTEHFDITNQHAVAHWLELLAAIRVKIYKGFYMGWSARFRILLDCSQPHNSNPWYIPGFGNRNMPFGFTYTLGYRFQLTQPNKLMNPPTGL